MTPAYSYACSVVRDVEAVLSPNPHRFHWVTQHISLMYEVQRAERDLAVELMSAQLARGQGMR